MNLIKNLKLSKSMHLAVNKLMIISRPFYTQHIIQNNKHMWSFTTQYNVNLFLVTIMYMKCYIKFQTP